MTETGTLMLLVQFGKNRNALLMTAKQPCQAVAEGFLSSWLTSTLSATDKRKDGTNGLSLPRYCFLYSFSASVCACIVVVSVYTCLLLTLYGALSWIKRKSLCVCVCGKKVTTLCFQWTVGSCRRQHRAASAAAHTAASALGSGVSGDFNF